MIQSKTRGLSNIPDPWWVVKLVMVCDRSRQPVTVWQFVTCWRLSVAAHTYMNVCGIIILEWGILLHFFRLFICVVCRSSWPVTNCHPFWWPITDWVYRTCIENQHFFSGQHKNKQVTSMSSKLEPVVWSYHTGQEVPCFDRCQLTVTWISNIKEGCHKPMLVTGLSQPLK